MSTPVTFAAQRLAVDALAQIAATFGHLPQARFEVGDVYPDRLSVSLHGSLDSFDAWRAALGIPADAVVYNTFPGHMTLIAHGPFAGAKVELIGYAPALPEPATAGGAA